MNGLSGGARNSLCSREVRERLNSVRPGVEQMIGAGELAAGLFDLDTRGSQSRFQSLQNRKILSELSHRFGEALPFQGLQVLFRGLRRVP